MTDEKRKKAEILLDAIGEIDDPLLEGALAYRKKQILNTRVLATAAAVFIVFCLAIAAPLVKDRFGSMKNNGGAEMTPDGDNSVDNFVTLDSVFLPISDRAESSYRYVTDPDKLPYLDGKVYIVWKYEGDTRYYLSRPLRDGQFETVKYELGKGEATGERSLSLKTKVWVLLGDGRVISPYLHGSQGNISNEIFDYEVEIVPDSRIINKIQAMIG